MGSFYGQGLTVAYRVFYFTFYWLEFSYLVTSSAKEITLLISQQFLPHFTTDITYPVIVFSLCALLTFDVTVSFTSIPVHELHFIICNVGVVVEIQ